MTCGDCLAHVGTSRHLGSRVRELARLGVHHGTSDVLCAAYCTAQPPMVRWEVLPSVEAALLREAEFKRFYGEPPQPEERYADCRRARRLRNDLLRAAGGDTWEAGYIEAVFAIGNSFKLLLTPRFERIWRQLGYPPGPWASGA